jgi:hypothetical protein
MATQTYTKQNQEYEASLSLASDADIVDGDYQVFASLIHEWGDTVVDEALADRDAAGEYSYTFTSTDLNSYGKHKILWRYTEGGEDFTSAQYINVYTPYITEGEFFDSYPEFEDSFSDKFDGMERRIRGYIDTVCGQNFQSIIGKNLTYEGTDNENLFLGVRCLGINSVTQKPDVDITAEVEITVESKMYIRRLEQLIPVATQERIFVKPEFTEGSFYIVNADWGWGSVPVNITEAAALLLSDLMAGNNTQVRQGISQLKMDQYSVTYTDSAMVGTGNIEADVLLMDYTLYTMGMI